MRATAVTGPETHHGEGPCWSPAWGGLRYVDLTVGDLMTLRDDGLHRLDTGHDTATFVRPRAAGGYVIGTRHGIALADGQDARATRAVELVTRDGVRMNDGGTTPDGRLLAGSMAEDGDAAIASLELIDGSLGVTRVLDSIGCSNGVDFSPAGDLAYYVDTATSRIDVLDYVGGELVNRRPFVTIDDGYPDGLTVDADGTVWVALWGAGAVHAYDSAGALAAVIEVDARQVSACTFGGDDLRTLYITTSRQGLANDEDPLAGSLFAVVPGATGRAVVPFAG